MKTSARLQKQIKLTLAQQAKFKLLFPYLKKKQKILDLGCGSMWLTKTLREKKFNCTGFADVPPADIVGDIKKYRFRKQSFDVVIALEVVEHVSCFEEIRRILKPNGLLILSTPMPHFDWLCLIGEKLHVLQDRGTPHCNLTYLKDVPFKKIFETSLIGIIQFGVFKI
jgi:2-polyprenyl-3-methyl-5-hydroxy-6-metoxy-1,4-benzoquinol methylase